MTVSRNRWLLSLAVVIASAAPAAAWIPYTSIPIDGPPTLGPGVIPADYVYGKEYSHDIDFSVLGPAPDPQQVIAWDGGGGTADATDFSGTRPAWEPDQEIDAIANTRDALFDDLLREEAHLTFSHDDLIAGYGGGSGGPSLFTLPSFGPIFLSNGEVIGGAGEVSAELGGAYGAPAPQFTWASAPEVNSMPLPMDVDGTELWGREPRSTNEPEEVVFGDTDKYSLDADFLSGVSVWNGAGTPYLDHATIVGAVEAMLGPIPSSAFSLRDETQGRQAINLDALMVSDTIEEGDFFHEDVGAREFPIFDQNGAAFEPVSPDGAERGDTLIFSIRQILDPEDGDGYYSTGSELFVLDSLGSVGFLKHGGHEWSHEYALSELAIKGFEGGEVDGFAVIDINALEAIGEDQFREPVGLPGDYNGDGKVDAADYTVWRDTLGATGSGLAADGNGDGLVDTDDYAVWRRNYGAMASSPATAVPEPTAVVIAMAAAAAVVGVRRPVRSSEG